MSFLGRSQRPPAGVGDGGWPGRAAGAEAVPLGVEALAVVAGDAGGYVFVFEALEVRMEHLVVRAVEVMGESSHPAGQMLSNKNQQHQVRIYEREYVLMKHGVHAVFKLQERVLVVGLAQPDADFAPVVDVQSCLPIHHISPCVPSWLPAWGKYRVDYVAQDKTLPGSRR